jgi:hypothetical protein
MANQLSSKYTRDDLPTLDELQLFDLPRLKLFVSELEDDVGLINEELRMFLGYQQAQKEKEAQGVFNNDDDEVGVGAAAAASTKHGGRGKNRAYHSKHEEKQLVLSIEDKSGIAAQEAERLKADREKTDKHADDAREEFRATVEEAVNRLKEVKMEVAGFKRDVTGDKGVSADKVLRYMADRPVELRKHIAKTKEKCAQCQLQISKYLTQLRQREDVGEAFHEIDFNQLQIENHQFVERIEQKNEELVELKGTTTRTVQTLNALTDKLGALTADQAQLRKEHKLRQEHVDKLTAEIDQVRKEGAVSQKKNEALKIQHESVKVPLVEDYIAQKAETYELQKAVQNWKRKVEIASGHVAVMKQQMLSLRKKLGVSTTTKALSM